MYVYRLYIIYIYIYISSNERTLAISYTYDIAFVISDIAMLMIVNLA